MTILAVSFGGCDDRQPSGEGSTSGSEAPGSPVHERVSPENAVGFMAEARCNYEQRCGTVGPDLEYADMDHCLTRFKGEFQKELNTWECPGGINRDALSKCLTEIRNNDCNSPFDSLERMITCRSGNLCEAVAP